MNKTYSPPTNGVTKINFLDPQRITDRLFGGPHFKEFLKIDGTERVIDPQTGDVYLMSTINLGWEESFNVYPILCGPGRKLSLESTTY
ncbi:hypothetical protein EKK58_08240 [Candidatus Dependentiae bacterium]|nr:MAG: hypothetical protein EKK58_08240 [Candidatus Dependentiae bacterium]